MFHYIFVVAAHNDFCIFLLQRRDEQYFEFNLEEQLENLKKYKSFGVEDMYTIADVWGWTWEKDLEIYWPEKWSREREVTLGMKLMKKVHN